MSQSPLGPTEWTNPGRDELLVAQGCWGFSAIRKNTNDGKGLFKYVNKISDGIIPNIYDFKHQESKVQINPT